MCTPPSSYSWVTSVLPTTHRKRHLPIACRRRVAVFTSEFLGATSSVMFRETFTGAVALHTLAQMDPMQHGTAVDIIIADGLPLPKDSPARQMLSETRQPMYLREHS